MLMYGICCSNVRLKTIKWDVVKDMLRKFDPDLYQECVEDLDGDLSSESLSDWFSNYESGGCCGGVWAFLRDFIRKEEHVELNVEDPNCIYLGLSANVPWYFHESVRNLSEDDFHNVLRKYVGMIADAECEIRWWRVDEDLDW